MMTSKPTLLGRQEFISKLFEIMKSIHPGVYGLELYEFKYGCDTVFPPKDEWAEVKLLKPEEVERLVNSDAYYENIQIKPKDGEKIKLDDEVTHLTRMLFWGLVTGGYLPDWVNQHFYFDLRGFNFLHRTEYFTKAVVSHLGGKPCAAFERKQDRFVHQQSVGYQEFKAANREVDGLLLDSIKKLIAVKGTPIVIAIAGATAAGKTEIVERLKEELHAQGLHTTSIEMDNYLTDRDYREEKGIHSLGKEAIHLNLFIRNLEEIIAGKQISIPRYDTIDGGSSHDLDGNIKTGHKPIVIEPADIIFIEGNFPFLIQEVVHLIGIKIVYLTDDEVRLKRKWKRDIDYRKKYDPYYFRNRFFKDQYPMAKACYIPQMEVCDILVDTTRAAFWVTPETAQALGFPHSANHQIT